MSEFQIGDKVFVSVAPFYSNAGGKVVEVVEHMEGGTWLNDTQLEQGYIEQAMQLGYEFQLVTSQDVPLQQPVVGNPKYNREIKPGVFVDVYDVLYAFKVTDPCLQHAIKKALAAGQRGHKDTRQDLVDIRDSAQRALDSYDLWSHNA